MDVSDSKDLLRRFGLLKDGRPLNVAMALFGKDLTFYPHCILKMAWFKGKDKTIFLDNRMVSGNIIQLQSEAMAFCFKQLNLSGVVRGLYRKEELYLILREGRRKWILGNLLYCVCFSILYTLVLILISMLLLAGYLQPGLEWGKVWTTLAVTDTAEQIGLTVPVSQYVIFQYSPLQAMLLAALLNVLVNIFYSFLLWGLNLTTGRLVSIATVCASMCLVTRVMYLPDFVWYLTPAAWADLGSLYMNGPSNATVVKSVIRLLILDGVLGAYAYIRTLHADLGK